MNWQCGSASLTELPSPVPAAHTVNTYGKRAHRFFNFHTPKTALRKSFACHFYEKALGKVPRARSSVLLLRTTASCDKRGQVTGHFVYLSTHSRNVLYQNFAFCGFITQCPSSGNTTSFDGTPCRCSALKNSSDCVYGTR
jgi:hypothetical protein